LALALSPLHRRWLAASAARLAGNQFWINAQKLLVPAAAVNDAQQQRHDSLPHF
jgi:hypothetical protein